ncbi:MAG: DegT/DnrJ/EryC1/StrS family aminotransferase, partial [Candidatus Omnitrophica bacterium]|nr:DegT/DnrJ/EryC1/StrS family aminotransferase [Candidatus Omnitrophota bacterium]
MKIPLLDLQAQYQSIKADVDEAVKHVIDTQTFILSEEVSSLEKEMAEYCGVKYAAGVASGTDALILALKALGIGDGDRVITTPATFFATCEAISILGATPVFADIDPGTYNIDPEKIEKVLKNSPVEIRKTIKAVIPVHLYGQCADMEGVMQIAQRYNLKVIEDCAQAIGAPYKGKKAGSFGNAGCFSFFPSKNLGGFGDGGMVISNDQKIIDRIKGLRVHGSTKQYIHTEIGYNSRLDSLQAAILRVKLKKLDSWLEGRRNVAQKYNKAFAKMKIKIPKVDQECVHTYHQYSILVDNRDGLLDHLNKNGVASRVYYPVPMHLQPCYKELGYLKGDFPISEHVSDHIL